LLGQFKENILVMATRKSGINSPVEEKVVEIYHYFTGFGKQNIQKVVGNGISGCHQQSHKIGWSRFGVMR